MGTFEVALVAVLWTLVGLCVLRIVRRRARRLPAPRPEEEKWESRRAIEEAKKVRAESRETRIKIEANVTVGRPSAELFDKAMNLGRFGRPHANDEGERGREDT